MGKIAKGIVGGVSGTVGPVVGAIVRGEATVRSKPTKSKKPATASQVVQRDKFGLATRFVKSMKSIVALGYSSYSQKMSTTNAAVQDLLDNALTGIAPNYKIDYPTVKLSKGGLDDTMSMAMLAPAAAATVKFTWNAIEGGAEEAANRADDRLVLAFYDDQTKRSILFKRVAARSEGKFDAELPFLFVGHELQVWAFFVSPDLKLASPSQYLGKVKPIQ